MIPLLSLLWNFLLLTTASVNLIILFHIFNLKTDFQVSKGEIRSLLDSFAITVHTIDGNAVTYFLQESSGWNGDIKNRPLLRSRS